ncbi:hypothetical protein [Cytobacillus praedii]|uniref:hypothetical protein n=1 Tax=Cytobacillus praedii TaxID=1742358 RepID=UPI002E24A117|nr:hypothetical protein [Cytobacillus praedii]
MMPKDFLYRTNSDWDKKEYNDTGVPIEYDEFSDAAKLQKIKVVTNSLDQYSTGVFKDIAEQNMEKYKENLSSHDYEFKNEEFGEKEGKDYFYCEIEINDLMYQEYMFKYRENMYFISAEWESENKVDSKLIHKVFNSVEFN